MTNSLVAINIITKDNKIVNKNRVPLLFYWDGTIDIYEAMHNSEDFINFLYNTVINKDNYTFATFAFFKYYTDDGEHYYEDKIDVQIFLPFKNMSPDKVQFYKLYLINHFLYLYKSAYHSDYNNGEEISIMGVDDAIIDIYDEIQHKYPKRVIKSTVINYIRGELQNTDKLSIDNCDWIINQLENLLNERK